MNIINNVLLRRSKAKLKPPVPAEIPPPALPTTKATTFANRMATGRKNAKASVPRRIAVMPVRFIRIKVFPLAVT
jgi:hypothetical protein